MGNSAALRLRMEQTELLLDALPLGGKIRCKNRAGQGMDVIIVAGYLSVFIAFLVMTNDEDS